MKTQFGRIPTGLLALAVGATLVGCAGTPTRESTGAAIDDTAITAHVKAALVTDPETKARQIHVTTYRGVVELSGFVDSKEESRAADRIAMHEPGVRSVKDELQVAPQGSSTVGRAVDDSAITAKVKAALVANPDTKAHEINVTTEQGVVMLSGFVDSNEERHAAVQVAQGVQGVRRVDDALQIKPRQGD